ncbi:hypothetical protein ACIHFC_28950 [Streptomyces sp. NPDC052013]|uniref:hypothetical protein n=1 Tax=Streptomyces sp. NPDC052013 TaxID=3365679 RepID=UPI0037D89612
MGQVTDAIFERPITVKRKTRTEGLVPWFTVYPPIPADASACQEPCCRLRRGEVAPPNRPFRVQCAHCLDLPNEVRAPGRLWVARPLDAVAAMSQHDRFAHL